MGTANGCASCTRGLGHGFGTAHKGIQVDDVERCALHSVHCVSNDGDIQCRRCGSRYGKRHRRLVSRICDIKIGKVRATVNDVPIFTSIFPEVSADRIER